MVATKKILFIGSINIDRLPTGGEEFKNQLFLDYFKRKYRLKYVDTYHWSYKPFTIIKLLAFLIFFRFDKIIISASSLSTYRLIILIHYLLPWLLKKIIYAVIGGYFPEGISSGFYKKKYYLLINKIIVEGVILKDKLHNFGLISNVIVIPNFKSIKKVWISNEKATSDCFRFVFLSSIMEEKGVKLIFDALGIVKEEISLPYFRIDFYGPIENKYKSEFSQLLNLYAENSIYCGYLNIMGEKEISYKKLADYDVMLFPSFYKGEGFPGVILDAYIAGLPVIASDWNMNRELVKNGETGFLVQPNNAKELAKTMVWMLRNRNELLKMKKKSNDLAFNYDIIKVLDRDLLPILSN